MARLAAGIWVDAYMRILDTQMIPAFVVARGDATAGAIVIKINTLDGTARVFQRVMQMDGTRPWDVLAQGAERDVDTAIGNQRRFDPDLWVIEVEDRRGRHLLDMPALAD
ncbi:MAG: hypothetical protein ACJA1E_000035 [Paracoccaceae bacterium]|jgi:hypothetical protein